MNYVDLLTILLTIVLAFAVINLVKKIENIISMNNIYYIYLLCSLVILAFNITNNINRFIKLVTYMILFFCIIIYDQLPTCKTSIEFYKKVMKIILLSSLIVFFHIIIMRSLFFVKTMAQIFICILITILTTFCIFIQKDEKLLSYIIPQTINFFRVSDMRCIIKYY